MSNLPKKIRILIFGGTGMLGHMLVRQFDKDFDVWSTVRGSFETVRPFGIFQRTKVIEHVDVVDPMAIHCALETANPDVVINAVGLIKQKITAGDALQIQKINVAFPKLLAHLSTKNNFRLITMSTDCVFDGRRGNYSEADVPNADDVYGKSKISGEVDQGNALTLRTSVVGRELTSCHSIVEWFLSHRGRRVQGYTNVFYSGFPTVVLADIISTLIREYPALEGIYNVSSDRISKFQLLTLLNDHYCAGVEIEPNSKVVLDRSLDSSLFRQTTGFKPAPWGEMVAAMARDNFPYDAFR